MKKHVNVIQIPAKEKRTISYVTADGKQFENKWHAETHERLINARQIRDTLNCHNDWFYVCSHEELESVWLCASEGRWWDSQKEHYVSLPAWVQVEAWQDQDRYWHTEIEQLTDYDFREMATPLTNALHVITKTPHIVNYLTENDPMALEQCLDALDELV